jgi:hypothetical protein
MRHGRGRPRRQAPPARLARIDASQPGDEQPRPGRSEREDPRDIDDPEEAATHRAMVARPRGLVRQGRRRRTARPRCPATVVRPEIARRRPLDHHRPRRAGSNCEGCRPTYLETHPIDEASPLIPALVDSTLGAVRLQIVHRPCCRSDSPVGLRAQAVWPFAAHFSSSRFPRGMPRGRDDPGYRPRRGSRKG